MKKKTISLLALNRAEKESQKKSPASAAEKQKM